MEPEKVIYAVFALVLIVGMGIADTILTIAAYKLKEKTGAEITERANGGWLNPFALDPVRKAQAALLVYMLWLVGLYIRSTGEKDTTRAIGFMLEALGTVVGLAFAWAVFNNSITLLDVVSRIKCK